MMFYRVHTNQWRRWWLAVISLAMVLVITISSTANAELSTTHKQNNSVKNRVQYDRGTIFRHMSYIMDIKNEAEDPVFVRWEHPVRYYVEGLDKNPQLMSLFEEQLEEIQKYTGLEIIRHDDLYLEYRDESLNDRAAWPNGKSTVVALFFTTDMAASFRNPKVVKILKAFGDDPEAEYEKWKKYNNKQNLSGKLGVTKYGLHRDGLKFYFHLADISFLRKKIETNALKDVEFEFLQTAFDMVCGLNRSNIIPSILNAKPNKKGIYRLTEFDKALLDVYYSSKVKSGMSKLEALLTMNEMLVERFNSDKD